MCRGAEGKETHKTCVVGKKLKRKKKGNLAKLVRERQIKKREDEKS